MHVSSRASFDFSLVLKFWLLTHAPYRTRIYPFVFYCVTGHCNCTYSYIPHYCVTLQWCTFILYTTSHCTHIYALDFYRVTHHCNHMYSVFHSLMYAVTLLCNHIQLHVTNNDLCAYSFHKGCICCFLLATQLFTHAPYATLSQSTNFTRTWLVDCMTFWHA
jgi:hypothetical protein